MFCFAFSRGWQQFLLFPYLLKIWSSQKSLRNLLPAEKKMHGNTLKEQNKSFVLALRQPPASDCRVDSKYGRELCGVGTAEWLGQCWGNTNMNGLVSGRKGSPSSQLLCIVGWFHAFNGKLSNYNIQHSFAMAEGSWMFSCSTWIPYFCSCVIPVLTGWLRREWLVMLFLRGKVKWEASSFFSLNWKKDFSLHCFTNMVRG